MKHRFQPKGTCSIAIDFEITPEGRLHDIHFTGGCSGNTQGLGLLAEGMDAQEYVKRCRGIRCKEKPTSCPDQLAIAVQEALAQEAGQDMPAK